MSDPIRDALTHLITEIDLLAAASEGVSGLDMNGGLEPWSSLLEGGESSIWLGDAIADGRAALAAQPPAPATSSTLDLDALLSPEGAYQRGTGHEDDAQSVSSSNGPEWWAPLHGCDTLDNLLDQLRARILPHLRPPVAGIDVPGPDGDYGNVIDLCAAEGVDYRVGVPLLKRAREAWKVAAQPPAPYVRPLAIEAGDAQQDYRSWLTYFELGENCGGGAKLSQENCRSLAALLRSLSHTLLRQSAPSLDADTLKEVFAKAIARDWSTGWAALAAYVALAVEAQRAPSGNPPATEEYLAEARQEVAEFSNELLARRLQNLARVQARDGREYSSALCERAAELILPASEGEREEQAQVQQEGVRRG